MHERSAILKGITDEAERLHREIAGCAFRPVYTPSVPEEILNGEDGESLFLQKLEEILPREIENGSSLCGIQRDDIRFFIDDNEAKVYASQGQQRTVVLCMKLALTEYIKQKRDEYPVLLLDDIMSELDENHRTYLAAKIRDKQVLITCTDKTAADGARFIRVTNGSAECL
jgi:DNA replication and repair protein RecF